MTEVPKYGSAGANGLKFNASTPNNYMYIVGSNLEKNSCGESIMRLLSSQM